MIGAVTHWDWAQDPFQDLYRLQREVNRLFSDVTEPAERFPALNLWSSDDEAVVMVELPGVDPKKVDLSVVGHVLTLQGERAEEPGVKAEAYHRRERSTGAFARSVRLPFDVESDKVQARYEHGVLRITLPRKESTKPRRIAIAAE